MLLEIILNIILFVPNQLISHLPIISLDEQTYNTVSNVTVKATEIFQAVSFFIPVPLVLFIMGTQFLMRSARSVMALVRRIKGFVPTVGE